MERSGMEAEALGALLARTNATLNLSSGILLMFGWVFIRRGGHPPLYVSVTGFVVYVLLYHVYGFV